MAQIFFRKKLQFERSLGEKLRSVRKRKKFALSQVEEETKVRQKYLEALEAGDYLALPADVYALGFLSKYAEFLKLPKDELMAQYRREKEASGEATIPILAQFRKEKLIFSPRLGVILIGLLLVLALGGYIFYSIKHFTAAPALEISSPSTDTVVREDVVSVVGKTDIGCSLTINDQTVYIDNLGNFRESVHLQLGVNNIEVRSTNRVRKVSAKVVQILAQY